jgi:hypothetical protein
VTSSFSGPYVYLMQRQVLDFDFGRAQTLEVLQGAPCIDELFIRAFR